MFNKIIIAFLSIFIACSSVMANPLTKDRSSLKFAFLFAMPEEAKALDVLHMNLNWENYLGYKIAHFSYKKHPCVAIITGVGKAVSAGGAVLALEKYSPDLIINVGSAGGINCNVGDIVLSQRAMFHDVNLGAINLKKYQLPDQPIIFHSKHDVIKAFDIKDKISKDVHIIDGLVISSDQFLKRAQYYKDFEKDYPQARATEMEAASIASICSRAGYDYLFVKKISNVADNDALNTSFGSEILKFKDKVGQIVLAILNN